MNNQQILERKQRGYELSQRVRIQKDGEFYIVPSSKTGNIKSAFSIKLALVQTTKVDG
jgi:hypothetical protein